jgi:hypothetical protein
MSTIRQLMKPLLPESIGIAADVFRYSQPRRQGCRRSRDWRLPPDS